MFHLKQLKMKQLKLEKNMIQIKKKSKKRAIVKF